MANKVYTGRMKQAVPFNQLDYGTMFKVPGTNQLWMKLNKNFPSSSFGSAASLADGFVTSAGPNWKVIPLDRGTTVHIDQGA